MSFQRPLFRAHLMSRIGMNSVTHKIEGIMKVDVNDLYFDRIRWGLTRMNCENLYFNLMYISA